MATVSLRAATEDDAALLTEVVIAATRDQGRLGAAFDEATFRVRYEAWTREELATGDSDTQEARDRRVPLDLALEQDNLRARAFYERAGFVLVGSNKTEHLMRWDAD
jgi:hypothetical protein